MSGMPYLVRHPTTLFILLKDTEYMASAPWWCTAMFKTCIFHWFSNLSRSNVVV